MVLTADATISSRIAIVISPTSAPVSLTTENSTMRCDVVNEINPGKHQVDRGSGKGSGRSRGFELVNQMLGGKKYAKPILVLCLQLLLLSHPPTLHNIQLQRYRVHPHHNLRTRTLIPF